MPDRDTIALIRFGTGLRPGGARGGAADRLLAEAAAAPPPLPVPVSTTAAVLAGFASWHEARQARRGNPDDDRSGVRAAINDLRAMMIRDAGALAAAWIAAPLGFAERLAWFWAGHFAAAPRNAPYAALNAPHLAHAIRPHVAGRFADLLFAAVTHPALIYALDQRQSVGPTSARAQRLAAEGAAAGLNENLARELLELHTLGVGGAYTQTDVRELAELLTGLSTDKDGNPVMRRAAAEPGAETVLGRSYGGNRHSELADIRAVMDDLAVHPDTARHIAAKLARHFVADAPDPALVAAMAAAFRDTGGSLPATYAAMLAHPAAWAPAAAKVRQPVELVFAGMRALGLDPAAVGGAGARVLRTALIEPVAAMGQPWATPPGPQGWPEEAGAWITPQGLAARIDWAMAVPWGLAPDVPDPRAFVAAALADTASAATAFAAGAAERRAEGVGLVLASPEFNRR